MVFMKPFFNLLAKTVCKVHHLFSFLVGYHTGMIITADIPFLSKLIEQSNQAVQWGTLALCHLLPSKSHTLTIF